MEDIVSMVAGWLMIPTDFLVWPNILTHVIIPFIFVWVAFYKLLERISIFERVGIFRVIMATAFAFILMPFGPLVAIGAVGFIGIVVLREWKYRILFFIGIIALYLVLYLFLFPMLANIKF